MQSKNNALRRAFSMLELIAVVVMIGLISAMAMLSVGGQLDQVRLNRASQSIANADRKEREASRQSPTPGGLSIDRVKQRLRFSNSKHTLSLDARLKLGEIIVSPVSMDRGSITFAQSGQSPTYAIEMKSRRGASQWIVIVGMTGQTWLTDDTAEVRSLMAMGR